MVALGGSVATVEAEFGDRTMVAVEMVATLAMAVKKAMEEEALVAVVEATVVEEVALAAVEVTVVEEAVEAAVEATVVEMAVAAEEGVMVSAAAMVA